MRKKLDIVCSIPGGLYGNNPGSFNTDINFGNVIVDCQYTLQALTWLRRRANVKAISPAHNDPKGIHIAYELKR